MDSRDVAKRKSILCITTSDLEWPVGQTRNTYRSPVKHALLPRGCHSRSPEWKKEIEKDGCAARRAP